MDHCHESLRLKSQEFKDDGHTEQAGREFHQELQRKAWGGWVSVGFSLLPVDVGQSLHPIHIPQEIPVPSLYDSAGKQKC